MEKESSNRIYQRDQYHKGGLGRWYWDYRDRKVFSCIKEAHSILDIGCGEGVTLEKLVREYPDKRIKGIDYSQGNIEICRKYGLPVEYGSVYSLKIEGNSIDSVLFLEVIEHLDNIQDAVQEIFRVLKPGGSFVVIFPNDRVFKASRILTLKFEEAYRPSGHLRQCTPKAIEKLLEQTGFKVSKIKNIPFHFWFCSLHCLILAKK